MPIYLHHYAELFCFLAAILCYKKLRGSAFVWFIPFMGVVASMELLATYIYHVKGGVNYQLYNILTTAEFVFYIWFMGQFIRIPWVRKSPLFVMPALIVAIVLNMLFVQQNTFHSKTYLLGSIIILLYCFLYLYEVIREYDVNFHIEKQPVFWVVIGLLLFYLGGVGLTVLVDYFGSERRKFFSEIIRWLNVLLYGCFSIAFILCPPPKTKY